MISATSRVVPPCTKRLLFFKDHFGKKGFSLPFTGLIGYLLKIVSPFPQKHEFFFFQL